LNDDDALDIFKKAIPAALLETKANEKSRRKMGFLAVVSTKASRLAKAEAIVNSASQIYKSKQLELLSYNLKMAVKRSNQPAGEEEFGQVSGIIDDMIAVLENEGKDDEKHKEWCTEEFHTSEGEQAEVQDKADSIASGISELTDEAKTTADDIAMLEQEIKAMDASVALASINRKKEHAEYTESLTLTEAAIQLIEKAKNRLQKFYNPALYKKPEKKELSMEDAIYSRMGGDVGAEAAPAAFVQISAHVSKKVAPPAPPETFGAYQKAGGKSGGVMGLMDMLVTELQADLAQAKHDEQMSQKEYDDLMEQSRETRQQNAKSIVEKEGTKAGLEKKLEEAKESQATTQDELANVHGYIGELHSSCDFVMQNFDLRREARNNEIESLKNAKAVLAGANFSG
jgi:chromosome segregation ATPase